MTEKISTKHLVDPDLQPLLEQLPSFELNVESLAQVRSISWRVSDQLPVTAVEKIIEGPDGPLSLLWFDPSPGVSNRAVLLDIHGGGMVFGSAHDMQETPSLLAHQLGIPVATINYRLAPETPFPGPQEDCFAALQWLSENAKQLGIDPQRIGVTGQSAGGGLAAAVAQMARDRGGPAIRCQILVYPMLDHRSGSEADIWKNRHTGEFVWSRDSNQFGWEALRGDYEPTDARKGWFSPSLAEDLSGLPPAWIGVGTLDLFFDENLDYARRLTDAGVPVELHAYSGAFHGFNIATSARQTVDFERDMLASTARLLNLHA
ncbi:MAG: alpha/beta hydrolase [Sphingomonadaceae bacterium]|jgi:acetyl esterase|nr:alpha/beta hydrolase [Sphingomonadaceae bacterium]